MGADSAGAQVLWPDNNPQMLAQSIGVVAAPYAHDARQGRIDEAKAARRRARIDRVENYAAILASNTSCLDVTSTPFDIDSVYLHGYGFPRDESGPMAWADAQGLQGVLARLRDLAGECGAHCELPGNGLDPELIDGVLEAGARYTGEVVAPLNLKRILPCVSILPGGAECLMVLDAERFAF